MGNFIETALRALLMASPGVLALVGDRIYPLVIDQGAVLPALRYQRISGIPSVSQSGPGNHERSRFQIGAVGGNYDQAKATAKAVSDALHGFKGTVEGIRFQGIFRDDTSDDYQPEADRVEIQVDFIFWTEEV